MICNECSAASQVPGPLPTAVVAKVVASVVAMVVGVGVVLLPFAVAALIGGAIVAVGSWYFDLASFRAVVRRNATGVPLFAFHVNGTPHEHLSHFAPRASRDKSFPAYRGPVLQLRIGGWFRRLAILGSENSWRIQYCWHGLRTPVTMRNMSTGDTFTSSAPFQIFKRIEPFVPAPSEVHATKEAFAASSNLHAA